jgi:hypothetical protein
MNDLSAAILGNLLGNVLPDDTPYALILMTDKPRLISNSSNPRKIVAMLRELANTIEAGADPRAYNVKMPD